MQDIKQFHLMIPRGSRPGDTIVFKGAGHETAETLPADVTFVLQDKPNSTFKMEGHSDLVYIGKPADWRMVSGIGSGIGIGIGIGSGIALIDWTWSSQVFLFDDMPAFVKSRNKATASAPTWPVFALPLLQSLVMNGMGGFINVRVPNGGLFDVSDSAGGGRGDLIYRVRKRGDGRGWGGERESVSMSKSGSGWLFLSLRLPSLSNSALGLLFLSSLPSPSSSSSSISTSSLVFGFLFSPGSPLCCSRPPLSAASLSCPLPSGRAPGLSLVDCARERAGRRGLGAPGVGEQLVCARRRECMYMCVCVLIYSAAALFPPLFFFPICPCALCPAGDHRRWPQLFDPRRFCRLPCDRASLEQAAIAGGKTSDAGVARQHKARALAGEERGEGGMSRMRRTCVCV